MDFNMKILLVEDSSRMMRITKSIFKQLGFRNILEAKDRSVALKVLKEEKVGLILADWNMADMNGLELLKAVRSDESLKDIPFIMVTAEGQKREILEATKAVVNDYIVKPFTPETLEEKVKKVLLIAESRGIFDKK